MSRPSAYITIKLGMSIVDLDLSSSKIFLSPDGEVLLCPLVYIIDSLNATYSSE